MGRPTLPLGTHGAINVEKFGAGYRARTRYRDYDGVTRRVEKHGATKGAATNALLEAVRDRGRRSGVHEINRLTLMQVVIDAWWDKIEAGTLSPGTKEAYRYRLDAQVIPAFAKLRVHEVTVSLVYRHLRTVLEKHGPAIAKMTRTVLSGVLTLAVQHDALDRNPVREMVRSPTESLAGRRGR